MVRESERIRPYRPRRPHEDGCQCTVCKAVRGKATMGVQPEPAPVTEPAQVLPSVVPASSLKSKDIFEFAGKTYRAGVSKDCILGVNTAEPGAVPVTLGLNTMVKLKR